MGDSIHITVKTENGDVIVRKLALGDYAVLIRALKKLPAQIGKFVEGKDATELKNEAIMAALPEIIADSLPEFCGVLAAATDKDADFFLAGDLADALEVFAAAWELNDFKRVMATIKKLMPQKPADAKPQADPAKA